MKAMLINRAGASNIQHQAVLPPVDGNKYTHNLKLRLLTVILLLLTVIAPATLWAQIPDVTGTNNCATAPSGLVSWWRAESNALDSAATHHGVVLNGANFAAGMAGLAFNFSGSNQPVVIADAPALNPTNALTLEAWVYLPAYSANDGPVVVGKDDPYSVRQYLISVGRVRGQCYFRPHVGVPSGFEYLDGTTPVQTNTWYHVAMTYDGAYLRLYVNGLLDGARAVSGPLVTSSNPLQIGGYACGPWNLIGRVDELALYSRALSQADIQAIYLAGSAGKCPVGTTVKPAILSQPTSQTVYVGQSASFSVRASGSSPMGYQWRCNSYFLPGQTNASLVLNNVQLTNAGTYSVLVTNPAGLVLSSNALLTVLTAQTNCTSAPAGMVAWWRAEGNALDSLDGNHGNLLNGPTFAPGKVGQAFAFNGIDQLVQIPDRPALNPSNALTLEAWIYVSAFPDNDSAAIIGKDDPYGGMALT